MSGKDERTGIRPLTRKKKTGELYERLPETERQIEEVLRLPKADTIERVNTKAQDSPLFLKEETLVYLLQEAVLQGDDGLRALLATRLAERCARQIYSHARRFVPPDETDDCVQDILTELFGLLLAPDDRGDYAQVLFRKLLNTISIRVTMKYTNLSQTAHDFISIDAPTNETDESKTRYADEPEATEAFSHDELIDFRKGLHILPEPLRTAFVLRHYEDWQIDSIDPDVPTIAKHFKTSERTIRNWLKRATEILKEWQGGKR